MRRPVNEIINPDSWVSVRGIAVKKETVARLEEELGAAWIPDKDNGIMLLELDKVMAYVFVQMGMRHPEHRTYVIQNEHYTWNNIPVEPEAWSGLPPGETSGSKKMWFTRNHLKFKVR